MCGLLFISTHSAHHHHRITHRGPDATTMTHIGDYTLVHKRLAIVDLEEGSQPFNKDGNLTAFNGEIFNSPKSMTEVEFLASLLTSNNPNLHSILNGYYAIINVRKDRKEIRAFRDPFGVIPLFYTKNPFSISSEVIALDERASRYFEVPPGGSITYNLETKKLRVQERTLYDSFAVSSTRPSLGQLKTVFYKAVSRTARHSDVGFSLALSGGLDSSMILASLVDMGILPTRIISVDSAESKSSEEFLRAERLVKAYGLESIWKVIKPSVGLSLSQVASLPWARNPIKDFAFTRHSAIAEASPTKVILCGEGADELDFGYITNSKEEEAFSWKTQNQKINKRFALLHGMARFSLDRVNYAGMIHSKEYRVPFLDMDFARLMLSTQPLTNKENLRSLASTLGLPDEIVNSSKFGLAETEGRASVASL